MRSLLIHARHKLFLCFVIGLLPAFSRAQPQMPSVEPLLQKADSLFAAGDYKAAGEAYKDALDRDSASIPALRGVGAVAFAKEDWGAVKDRNRDILKLKPDDQSGNYYLGIAYRESGKFKALLLRKKDFGTSEKYFKSVIKADSSFQDVLFQRGLLERQRENWIKALKWGYRQIALKPDLVGAQVGLFRLYRLFLVHEKDREIKKWLKSRKDDWAEYFAGEQDRRKKRFDLARKTLEAMLAGDLSISKMPVYLSLIRLHVQQGEDEAASEVFRTALDSMASALDADILYEDLKYIFTDRELARYKQLRDAADKKQFYHEFVISRDPVPASPINYRFVEHFRRLMVAEESYWFDGVRAWVNNPDKSRVLEFPQSYNVNHEFNDKGLVYIRHGEPDDRATTLGDLTASNESWHYYKRPDRPEYTFHFLVDQFATGENWRLVPYLTDRRMLEDRLGMDARVNRMYTSPEINPIQDEYEIREEILQAMSTDFNTWDNDIKPLDMPFYTASFLGKNNATQTEIYLGVPIDELKEKKVEGSKVVVLEHGATVFDKQFNEHAREFEKTEIALNNKDRIFNDFYLNRYAFSLRPGLYDISFFAKDKNSPGLGGYKFDLEVPAYDSTKFSMSDLVLAYEIRPEKSNGDFGKGELTIIPNPSRTFTLSQPLFLYFEVYDLSKDADGVTSYEMETEIVRLKEKKSILENVFRLSSEGQKQLISIKDQRTGSQSFTNEFVSFDVSNLEDGEYELVVKLQDLNSRKTVQKSIALTLNEK